MNEPTFEQLMTKVDRLERRLRFYSVAAYPACVLIALSALIPVVEGQQKAATVIRARGIVIEDERGRDRIVIGAPVPNPKEGVRISPSTGLVINDPDGYERFGLGLKADGSVGMGFDAPRGTGDERNRERINLVADPKGGSICAS